jgi:hypothetical protein
VDWFVLMELWLTEEGSKPACLRRGSASARLLRLRVRIPPGAWMFVSCDCFVMSDRGFCVGLITRPEESYRVFVCDSGWSWSLDNEETLADEGLLGHGNDKSVWVLFRAIQVRHSALDEWIWVTRRAVSKHTERLRNWSWVSWLVMSDVLPENYNLPLYLLLQTFLNPECLGGRITYLFQYLSMCIVVTVMSVKKVRFLWAVWLKNTLKTLSLHS